MAQLTRKGDKYSFNTSKSDYKSNSPVNVPENEPPIHRIKGEGVGRSSADRRKSPYKGSK